MSSTLSTWGERLWTLSGDDVKMLSIPFSTRATIAQLATGQLWIHSPVVLTPERRRVVEKLGSVAHIVAPNCIHSLGVEPWSQTYPSATVWVSPRFPKRHPDVKADHVLDDDAPAAWAEEIDQHVFAGSGFLDEVVFLHRASKTLVVTDLIQRHEPNNQSWFWRITKSWAGVLGDDGGTSRDLRWTFRDRDAARRSAEHILDWEFDRLVISHGACVHENAKAVVAKALAWLNPS
jgi:hypothetical protein